MFSDPNLTYFDLLTALLTDTELAVRGVSILRSDCTRDEEVKWCVVNSQVASTGCHAILKHVMLINCINH